MRKLNFFRVGAALSIIAVTGMMLSCSKEDVKNNETSNQTETKLVPFFEVAKGDSVSKDVCRAKPDYNGTNDATILFSTESQTKAQGNSTGTGYIYNLKTSVRDGNNAPATMEGYTKIPVDLNEGAGGKYIFLYYVKADFDPLTSLSVSYGTPNLSLDMVVLGRSFANGGWTDLNQGAGGDFIYLYGSRASKYGTGIKDILIASASTSSITFAGWTKINKDLNHNCGGKYIYIFYKK